MQKNFDPQSIENIKKIIESGIGQQLITTLQQLDPQRLNAAIQQANSGDYNKISQTLTPLLQSDDIQKLLRQMEE